MAIMLENLQQFKIQNLEIFKPLYQGKFTIFNKLFNCWDNANSSCIWNCWKIYQ